MIRESRFAEDLVRACPSLPYLGLGAWLAWAYLVYSGSMWLSDVEVNGSNIATFYIVSTMAYALVSLGVALCTKRVRAFFDRESVILGGGVLTAFGWALTIVAGPYYLAGRDPYVFGVSSVFLLGIVLTGIGTTALGLRSGSLYGGIPPRMAIKRTALSYLVLAFVYFAFLQCPRWAPVAGGPSLAGILAMVTLPVLAAVLLALPARPSCPDGQDAAEDVKPFFFEQRRRIPSTVWKLFIAVFVFSFVENSVRSHVVYFSQVETTLFANGIIMLLRTAMAVAFALFAIWRSSDRIDFGRIYSFVMVAAVAVVAFVPLFGAADWGWSIVVSFVSVVFEFVLWCILSFLVFQKRVSPVFAFGFGYGGFMLGSAIGWIVGIWCIPLVSDPAARLGIYLVMATIDLLCVFVLFSEKDFDRLFEPLEGEDSLQSLFDNEKASLEVEEEGSQQSEKKGRFSQAIEGLVEEFRLTPREADVLRQLAMGYGADAAAEHIGVSWNTVRTHTRNIYVKLDVHSRQELMDLVDARVQER